MNTQLNSESPLNFKATLTYANGLPSLIELVTEELKKEGFGVLTRIDFHEKIKEKLGHNMNPVVILGACMPQAAYQAYQMSTDVTALMPCNAVIRELNPGQYSLELTKPSFMLQAIPHSENLKQMACDLDDKISRVIKSVARL
ncbi:MAG: DUF302 domain-containing protein [Xanthomonadaceae bacterium]|nr:DUF302 domain-containing protein [Xanthomonadaceae bacterium]